MYLRIMAAFVKVAKNYYFYRIPSVSYFSIKVLEFKDFLFLLHFHTS